MVIFQNRCPFNFKLNVVGLIWHDIWDNPVHSMLLWLCVHWVLKFAGYFPSLIFGCEKEKTRRVLVFEQILVCIRSIYFPNLKCVANMKEVSIFRYSSRQGPSLYLFIEMRVQLLENWIFSLVTRKSARSCSAYLETQ